MVEPEETIKPEHTELEGNYPNPFNAGTTIRIRLSREEQVTLEVFDLLGRMVRRLVTARLPARSHQIHWNGRDSEGRHVASGVYVARL